MLKSAKHDKFTKFTIKQVLFPLIIVSLVFCLLEVILSVILQENWSAEIIARKIYPLISINEENTTASWFSANLWLAFSFVTFAVYFMAPKRHYQWLIIALIALYASVDEATEVHEYFYKIGDIFAQWLPFKLGFTWVIPGLIIAAIVVAILAKFILSQPKVIRNNFIFAGIMFLTGTVVLEVISGSPYIDHSAIPYFSLILVSVEEMLEMSSVSLVLATMVSMFEYDKASKTIRYSQVKST